MVLDTELLLLAEKGGYKVKGIPIRWVEDKDTRVNVPKTILENLSGLCVCASGASPNAKRSSTGRPLGITPSS